MCRAQRSFFAIPAYQGSCVVGMRSCAKVCVVAISTKKQMKIAVLALQLTCNGKIVLHKYWSRLAASRMGRVMPSRVQIKKIAHVLMY
jgi:hypothetical protein